MLIVGLAVVVAVVAAISGILALATWDGEKKRKIEDAAAERAHELKLAEITAGMVAEVACASDWPEDVQIPALFVRDSRRGKRVFDQDDDDEGGQGGH